MTRFARLLVTGAALLALPASAAYAQIPGAHYEGTTDQNYPISFDVSAGGTSLTNVVASYNAFCSNGTTFTNATNSQYPFSIVGGAIDGYDEDGSPPLKMRGTFTSANSASGQFDAYGGTFSGGSPVFCNALEREWTATTTATAPGGGNPGGGLPGGGDPGAGGGGAPAVTVAWPRGVLLRPSLGSGFIVTLNLDQAADVAGSVTLRKADSRRYKLGRKARVIDTDRTQSAGGETLLEFNFSRAVARKLRKAKRLKLLLKVKATSASGSVGRAEQLLGFR